LVVASAAASDTAFEYAVADTNIAFEYALVAAVWAEDALVLASIALSYAFLTVLAVAAKVILVLVTESINCTIPVVVVLARLILALIVKDLIELLLAVILILLPEIIFNVSDPTAVITWVPFTCQFVKLLVKLFAAAQYTLPLPPDNNNNPGVPLVPFAIN